MASSVVGHRGARFVAVPPGGDFYLVANVLWNSSDEQALQILRRCGEAMAPSARLVVCQPVIRDGDEPHVARIHDLMNFWINGGPTRRAREWRELLAASGYRVDGNLDTQSQWSVIEARPARADALRRAIDEAA